MEEEPVASAVPDALPAPAAWKRLGVSRATFFRMLHDGRIAGILHAGKVYVTNGEINDYFNRIRGEAAKRRATRLRQSCRKD